METCGLQSDAKAKDLFVVSSLEEVRYFSIAQKVNFFLLDAIFDSISVI